MGQRLVFKLDWGFEEVVEKVLCWLSWRPNYFILIELITTGIVIGSRHLLVASIAIKSILGSKIKTINH